MIAIGQIARSSGVRGEVRVKLFTDTPDRFQQLTHIWVGPQETETQRYTIERVRFHQGQAVIKLGNVENRSVADTLKQHFLFVEDKNAASPAKGSYFIHEIVGMEVSTEHGVTIGTVHEVWQMPANDVWVVRDNGKEILLPATQNVIRSVDVQHRRIVIHALDGLLE